jgi:molybdopterin molybdotransferase
MISVEQATKTIFEHVQLRQTESVGLEQAVGRVLREDLQADRDFPPFHRVSMDGIAIRFASWQSLEQRFRIAATQPAGMPPFTLENPETDCIEIMTGAVCPEGADTVIRYEDLEFTEEEGERYARLTVPPGKAFQNVHQQGLDRKEGSKLLGAGRRLSPAEIAVAATVGKTELLVSSLPRITIIATGDELVEVGEKPLPHQIRMSNPYSLQEALKSRGYPARREKLEDDPQVIEAALERLLKEEDVLIISGGVSKGKTDYVPGALQRLGVEKRFHRVMQRPGKPLWFGVRKDGKVVFALPGNPVSSFMCLHRYVLPWLSRCQGEEARQPLQARLAEDVTFKPDLTYYMQAKVTTDSDGQLLAQPLHGHGSGDLANLLENDAFVELPQGRDLYKAGEVFSLFPYRQIF